jgi:hypothetical protein
MRETRLFRIFQIYSRTFTFEGPKYWGGFPRTNGEAVGTQPTGLATRVGSGTQPTGLDDSLVGWVRGVPCG